MVDALPEAAPQQQIPLPRNEKQPTLVKQDKPSIDDVPLQKAEERTPSIRGFITEVAGKCFDPATGKTYIPTTNEEIEEIAKRYGVKIIGMGSESVVFAKPSRTDTPTKEGYQQVISLFWLPRSESSLRQTELVSDTLHTLHPDAYPLLKAYQGKIVTSAGQEIAVTGTIREKVQVLTKEEANGKLIQDQVTQVHSIAEKFHLPFHAIDLYDIEEYHGNVQVRQTATGEYSTVFLDTIRGENSLPDLEGFVTYLRGKDSDFPRPALAEKDIIRVVANIHELLHLVQEEDKKT